MNLQSRKNNFQLPEIVNSPHDIWNYIAQFNNFEYYETDSKGVVNNNIFQNHFFVNKIESLSPRKNTNEIQFNGILFFGVPNDSGIDVDGYSGLFKNVIEEMLTKSFIKNLEQYISCNFEVLFNVIRPIYNSNKYTIETNTSGIEISYTIWI